MFSRKILVLEIVNLVIFRTIIRLVELSEDFCSFVRCLYLTDSVNAEIKTIVIWRKIQIKIKYNWCKSKTINTNHSEINALYPKLLVGKITYVADYVFH